MIQPPGKTAKRHRYAFLRKASERGRIREGDASAEPLFAVGRWLGGSLARLTTKHEVAGKNG